MAIEWKKPIEPRLIYLLAAASVVVLVLGIIFRPRERPAVPAASETQTAQLQQRILRSAVETTRQLSAASGRQAPSLAGLCPRPEIHGRNTG